jgi:phenylacetate-CoA ligase
LRLAQAAVEEQIDLRESAVRKIIVAGELGGSIPEVRRRIRSAWNGAEVFDHYGMTEVGPVAYQTPDRFDVLQILEDSYFAEIVRPETGEAAPPVRSCATAPAISSAEPWMSRVSLSRAESSAGPTTWSSSAG